MTTQSLPEPSHPSYVTMAYERMKKGYRVTYNPWTGRFALRSPAQIVIGRYSTPAEATRAYVEAAS